MTPSSDSKVLLTEARDAMRELRLADGYAAQTGDELRFDRAFLEINQLEKRIDAFIRSSTTSDLGAK